MVILWATELYSLFSHGITSHQAREFQHICIALEGLYSTEVLNIVNHYVILVVK